MTASMDEDPDSGLSAREDAALARLYREGAGRSPSTLDESVLARAAKAQRAASRRRRRHLRGWSLAASLVLATGIGWRLHDEGAAKLAASAAKVSNGAPAPTAAAESAPTETAAKLVNPPSPGLADRLAAAPAAAEPMPRFEPAAKAAAPTHRDASKKSAAVAAAPTVAAKELRKPEADITAQRNQAPVQPSAAFASGALRSDAAAGPAPSTESGPLLAAIRALPPDARFIAIATGQELAPAAFAERLAAAPDVDSLLKTAAQWRLRQSDGSLVAADDWLRGRARGP